MVFKRRTPRTYFEAFAETFYPKGGWRRALWYVVYRVRRLPDPAHKIARGIAAGVFTCFTPFFGLHFLVAATLAWVLRGNMMAALLATFFGNPITFPFIAAISMELGAWILNRPPLPLPIVLSAFSDAALELWRNFMAVFTAEPTRWGSLSGFFDRFFLTYLVGGLLPGFATAIAFYILSTPVLNAYQKARVARLKKKFAKKREKVEAKRAASKQIDGDSQSHARAEE
ncbi:MAG: DUF2062 domain-containing protein [Boseongicola sp.]|nr:DUF2062 domain-containing protein [Boseongicola sp.]